MLVMLTNNMTSFEWNKHQLDVVYLYRCATLYARAHKQTLVGKFEDYLVAIYFSFQICSHAQSDERLVGRHLQYEQIQRPREREIVCVSFVGTVEILWSDTEDALGHSCHCLTVQLTMKKTASKRKLKSVKQCTFGTLCEHTFAGAQSTIYCLKFVSSKHS